MTKVKCYVSVQVTYLLDYHFHKDLKVQFTQKSRVRGLVQMEWNGICFLGQRPRTGTSKVIQCRQKERKKGIR